MWVSVTIAGFRSPLLLEVAVGLPLNRFGDHRCFSSAVLSSFRVIVVVEKASGAEVLVVVDSGQDERSQLTSLGCGFNMSSTTIPFNHSSILTLLRHLLYYTIFTVIGRHSCHRPLLRHSPPRRSLSSGAVSFFSPFLHLRVCFRLFAARRVASHCSTISLMLAFIGEHSC
ncbi:uncharacterized protein LOC127739768 isoform X1 [Arachis duranensis]|uniref:Uncharacterized protein LOC127739768 isoform X1 n=1 Tax=Arachis duranensis TaxID=130453 RepID=A0A9C6T567_ARADU|nr:uncharacterized protein LOC127739768 isoform X1 [Arachis duranensis]